jgi:hypothetical protein
LRENPPRLGGDRFALRPDHHRRARPAGRLHGGQNMHQQRLPGQRMKDLGTRRAHAGAFAGGEHDGKAAALLRHFWPSRL